MINNRVRCFEFVLQEERSRAVVDPDRKYGVPNAVYLLRYGSSFDIETVGEGHAQEVYHMLWTGLKGDVLPLGVDYFLLDTAVTSGLDTTIRWAQLAIGMPPLGHFNQTVLRKVVNTPPKDLIAGVEHFRRRALKSSLSFGVDPSTWSNRITRARVRAWKMAGIK